jgi:two-component system response regulator VicR
MTKQKILLLEDDANLGFILKEHLELNSFAVVHCSNGVEGLAAYHNNQFVLALVDIMMPKKDGFTFAREVRVHDQTTPIIFLTAKSLKEDKIEGFKIGCDDFITKPFSMEELLLRIQAVLKRSAPQSDSVTMPARFTIGKYEFDYDKQTLQINNKPQKLTTKEADLLRLLCLNMNRTLERDVALKTVWQDDSYFSGRSMDVFVSRLRKYFLDDSRVEILNVHGKGFKLVVG